MTKKSKLSDLNRQLHHTEKATTKAQEHRGKSIEANAPRGERSHFLKITITMPGAMLTALKSLGIRRKEEGKRDTDVSSLIREAVADLLKKCE